ncbi:hypothetical protein ACN47E_001804 [Coniothyrium glycines]
MDGWVLVDRLGSGGRPFQSQSQDLHPRVRYRALVNVAHRGVAETRMYGYISEENVRPDRLFYPCRASAVSFGILSARLFSVQQPISSAATPSPGFRPAFAMHLRRGMRCF